MKKKTPEQELKALCKNIRQEIDHWEDLNRNGCSDPFWSDGCNMNLTRNHIIYAKRQIAEICEDHGISIPDEMYLPTPPEVLEYEGADKGTKIEEENIFKVVARTTETNYNLLMCRLEALERVEYEWEE